MKHFLFILTCLVLFACNTGEKEDPDMSVQSGTFRVFLKKFKTIDLPFIFRYGNVGDTLDFDAMPAIDPNSTDSIFVKETDRNSIKCYGMLKDTTKFFSLIYFYPADSYYPMLVTYDKQGNMIDKTSLIVNGCGGDCGLEYCSETGIIHPDLTIACVDTVKWKFSCDSLGEPIPDSDSVWVDSKNGKIKKNGKLLIQKEKQQKYRESL